MITRLFEQIRDNIDLVLSKQPPIGTSLWAELIELHPADIAEILSMLDEEDMIQIFEDFKREFKLKVFKELDNYLKQKCLLSIEQSDRAYILKHLSLSELADFLDQLSDEELDRYLKLLHERNREQVLSLLKFDPKSAGGIMDTNVFTLQEDLTLEKSVQILQRMQPNKDLFQQIFVTDKENHLVGSIKLEDLVLKPPETQLKSILSKNIVTILVNEDQEEVANKMGHYSLTIAPVVDPNGVFLGVINSETLIEILKEETGEDIYLMSAVRPIGETYFNTSFLKMFYQRGIILFLLILVQTFSTKLMQTYDSVLVGFGLIYFITMLTSTGGNASSQTSALAIQGLATGEINRRTRHKFILREFLMSLSLGTILGILACLRIYLTDGLFDLKIFSVGLSLTLITMVSMTLGSCMPIILKRLNIDPAHSAGPILTTMMDVIGILIYCYTAKLILVGW